MNLQLCCYNEKSRSQGLPCGRDIFLDFVSLAAVRVGDRCASYLLCALAVAGWWYSFYGSVPLPPARVLLCLEYCHSIAWDCHATVSACTTAENAIAVRLGRGQFASAHGEQCSWEMSTLFSLRIARFWFAEVFFFDLFPSFALFAQIDSAYRCFAVPRLRALPSNSRKPAGARLDRAL